MDTDRTKLYFTRDISFFRISSMVENLCTNFGHELEIKSEEKKEKSYFSFPSVDELAASPDDSIEAKLRTLGFGYRASYIAKTAKVLKEKGGDEYLHGLRKMPYQEARSALLELNGIGPKVLQYKFIP